MWQVAFLAEVELNLQLQPLMQASPSLATELQFFICLLEIKNIFFLEINAGVFQDCLKRCREHLI